MTLLDRVKKYYREYCGIHRGKKAPVSARLDANGDVIVTNGVGHVHFLPMRTLTDRNI